MTGLELIEMRKLIGISQAELAEDLGIRRETIGNWEKRDVLSNKAIRLISDYIDKLPMPDRPIIKIKGDNNSNIGNYSINDIINDTVEEDDEFMGYEQDAEALYIDLANTYMRLEDKHRKLQDENKKLREELNQAQKKLIELLSK